MAVELSETSIIIQQNVNVSRNRVWHAWTDPAELDRWWGPMDATTTTEEIDVEVGGEWVYAMTFADGTTSRHRVTYERVIEPARIDYSLKPDDPGVTDRLRASVRFTEQAGKTHVRLEMHFGSEIDRDDAIEYGVAKGTSETLQRLAILFEDTRIQRTGRGPSS